MSHEEPKVYSVKDLARIFNKDPETIRRWIKSGYLPATKIGGSYVIDAEVLRRVIRGENPKEEKE